MTLQTRSIARVPLAARPVGVATQTGPTWSHNAAYVHGAFTSPDRGPVLVAGDQLQARAVLGSADAKRRRESETRRGRGAASIHWWLADLRALHRSALRHAREARSASDGRRARGTLHGSARDAAVRDLLARAHVCRGEQVARPVRRAQRVRRGRRIAIRRTCRCSGRDRHAARAELEDALTTRREAVCVARAVSTARALLACSEAHVVRGTLHLRRAASARCAFHAGVDLVATRGAHEIAEVDVTRLRGRTSALRLDVTRLGRAGVAIDCRRIDRSIGLGGRRVLRSGGRARAGARRDRGETENEREPGDGRHPSNVAQISFVMSTRSFHCGAALWNRAITLRTAHDSCVCCHPSVAH